MRVLLLLALLISAFVFSCDETETNQNIGIAVALANYWPDQTELTTDLETRDGTMAAIQNQINGLNKKDGKDGISEIDALVNNYITQSEAAAEGFDRLLVLENNIKPYGEDKGIFTDICKGIYTKGKNTVISSGRMVRSGWRVLSGRQSLRQVLRDPESGIPFLSDAAEKLQKHNSDRDAAIRQSILDGNDQDGAIPLDQLPGDTPQDKVNSYLNLDEESSLKMNIRRDVMYWDDGERTRTAATAKELGEVGVKTVGDAYGGGIGEWTNEVLNQHINPGQDPNDKGSLNLTVNRDAATNPPITGPKTIIISKKNTPDSDPRITVIMDAPQALDQELPSGVYDIIVIAEGHIRTFIDGMSILQDQVQNQMAKLLTMADNAIVIESIVADPEVVMLGENADIHLTCVSTIGKTLSFDWNVTGGDYTNETPNKNDFRFKPSAEGTYTVSCTVSDNAGNSKTATTTVDVLAGALQFQGWTLSAETFDDDLINPGETATLELEFKNVGNADLTGTVNINGLNGIGVGFTPVTSTIEVGSSAFWLVNVQCPTPFSADTGQIEVLFNTQDQNNNPVTIGNVVDFPLSFYVEINPITSPVTNRVLTITGKVANPQLTSAIMTLDGDPDQAWELNLSNGNFTQQIALSGSSEPVDHTILVDAVSGSLTASDSEDFTSEVPPTALRVTLSWDTNGTDVDLWVTDPNGERCYYAHSTTASGLALDFDDTNGYGPENITTSEVIPGDYVVQVHYYSDHDSENAIGTNASVVIRQNEGTADEVVNNYYGYLTDTGDLWGVTTIHFNGRSWTLVANDTHSHISSRSLPAK
jgi:hypothetical protein